MQFINKANSLSLYRQFIRATRGLGDATARWETIEFVRADFERYKGIVDSVRTLSFLQRWAGGTDTSLIEQEKAKTLLALGSRQLKQLNSTGSLIGGASAKWRGRKGLK